VHQRPSPPHSVDEVAPNRFEAAPEVEQWMRSVFLDPYAPLHNPDHAHLEFATLGVLWTNKSYRKQQRWILGQAEDPKGGTGGAWKKGQREQQLTEWFGSVPDFVITLYAPRLKAFDDRSFCAIIEHELYHCAQDTTDTGAPRFSTITGRPLYAIRGHDVEEFFGVAARYGLPKDMSMIDVRQGLPLPQGWRWLDVGEVIMPGDMCCDPRGEPAEVSTGGTVHMTENHHPHRRRANVPPRTAEAKLLESSSRIRRGDLSRPVGVRRFLLAVRRARAVHAYPGLVTCIMSIRAPALTCHVATQLCSIECPHSVTLCGEWRAR
jgi:hypothetical protein